MPRKLVFVSVSFLAVGLAAGLVYVYATHEPTATGRPAMDASVFDLHIKTDKKTYTIGETPKLYATLTNKSGMTANVVLPLDGSDTGFRFPATPLLIDAPENAAPAEVYGGCGTMNPIHAGNFRTLAEGESIDLYRQGRTIFAGVDRGMRGAGTYTFRLSYSTDNKTVDQWIGGPMPASWENEILEQIAPLLDGVPRMTLLSNAIEIEYISGFESSAEALRYSPAEGFSVLSSFKKRPATEEEITALTEGICDQLNSIDFDVAHFRFVVEGLEFLASAANPEDAALFYSTIRPGFLMRDLPEVFQIGYSSPTIIAILMRLDPSRREDALITMLTTDEESGRTRPCLTRNKANLEPLIENEAPDVTRALLAIYDDLDPHMVKKKSLREELIRRGALPS